MFFPPLSCRLESDQPTRHRLMFWTTWPDYSDGLTASAFFPTRFRRVGSKLGTNSTWTDPWTALILATKGLSSKNPSCSWRSSLLSVIPAIEILGNRNPSYWWSSSLLSVIPATKGLSSRNPSYHWSSATDHPLWHYLSLSSSLASKGLINKKPSYSRLDLLLSSSPKRKDLINNNPFYKWTCLSLQQQKGSATDYPSLVTPFIII